MPQDYGNKGSYGGICRVFMCFVGVIRSWEWVGSRREAWDLWDAACVMVNLTGTCNV